MIYAISILYSWLTTTYRKISDSRIHAGNTSFKDKNNKYISNGYVKFSGVLCLMLILSSLSSEYNLSYAQATTEPATQAEGQAGDSPTDEESDEAGNGGTTNPNPGRLNRSVQSNGPVASEGWARAGFYGFIDIRQRLSQPDPDLLEKGLRLLTTGDFPPFNDRGSNDQPQGYNVDLARALCEELGIACTLKIVPFADIPDLIARGEADAALAGIANDPSLMDKLGFSNIYLQRPARFVWWKDDPSRFRVGMLEGKPVAVRGGSAHEAYLKAYMPQINRVPVTDYANARQLLVDERVMAIFGDAFQLLPIVSELDSPATFAGKPYYDQHFFGDGMAIAFQADNSAMKTLLDYGLLKLAQKGRMAELYAMHFPLDIYASY